MAKPKTNFNALFEDALTTTQSPGAFAGIAPVVEKVVPNTKRRYGVVPLDRLRVNPSQPRKHFDQQELEELGASILQHGLLEPLVVRESGSEEGYFDLACGERRWRAMLLKALTEADAVILEADTSDYLLKQIALIENVQRVDLLPYELAVAYDSLRKDESGEKSLTVEQLAQLLGKKAAHIDDHLTILRVPDDVRQLIIDDPMIPLRIIRDIGRIEEADNRAYLIQEVRAGSLSANAVTKILSELKSRTKTNSVYTEKSERQDQGSTVSAEATSSKNGTEHSASQSLPSLDLVLVTLRQKLHKDSNQFKKITERLTGEAHQMGDEEKKLLRESLLQWQSWTQHLLEMVGLEES